MAFVLGASVALAWALEKEERPAAMRAQALIETEVAFVPAIWWFEIGNVLLVNERRGRLTQNDTAAFLRALSSMSVQIDRRAVQPNMLALARSHRLTVYDAAYLELAMRAALPLATLDRALADAARAEGVALLG